jgi:ATP-binding cassette, subfamily B, bacterial
MTTSEQEIQGDESIIPFLKKIFGYTIQREKGLFFTMLFFVMIIGGIDAMFPKVFSSFIEDCLSHPIDVKHLTAYQILLTPSVYKYFLILLGMVLGTSMTVFVFVYCAGKIGERIILHLREALFSKLQSLSFSYFDQNSSGWLLSRIMSDTDRVFEVVSWGLIGLSWGLVMVIVSISMMFYLDPMLGLIVFLSLPVLFFCSMKLRKIILKYSRLGRKANSEMIGLINEHIHGIELNKSLSNESKATDIFSDKVEHLRKANYKSAIFSAMFFPMVTSIGSVTAAIVVCIASHQIITHDQVMTIALLSSFFVYAVQIFEPISDITNYYAIAQSCLSAGERIFSLIDEKPTIVDAFNDLPHYENVKGEVEFKNVTFSYNAEKIIIANLNLKIKAGSSIALVGPTGEGKTTIASLLGRFYEPTLGEICIDDVDYRLRTMASLRKSVGVVLQQPHIFSGTIRSNIEFGKEGMTDEHIFKILDLMGCGDWKTRLDEEIQPDGTNFSMGEKQLIALARVFIYDPAILILDEATSAIDSITERKLQYALDIILKNRTSIVIAHRLSTIRNCDRILYIQGGKISEDGSHEELMKVGGKYKGLLEAGV